MIFRWGLCLTMGVLMVACGDGNEPDGQGRVRIVHAVSDGPEMDVLLDGAEVESDLAYLSATDYRDVPAGDLNVRLNLAGTTTTLMVSDLAVRDGGNHTLIASGTLADIERLVLQDDSTRPSVDLAKLRVVHVGPAAPALDIYATAPNADLASETPIIADLRFGETSDYLQMASGDVHHFRAAQAGTKSVVIDAGLNVLVGGDVVTIMVAEEGGGGAPFRLVALLDQGVGTSLAGRAWPRVGQ